ncbi:unnamed protein product [Rodentolepis nana]|uniref:Uncharacterized protein n=1 Tax=Rodentolepis nana TaxID=102285 RepID=A0A3P7V9R3_RODNA|nr:unnamed protein product [Rodentolepis nana]
MLCEIAMGTCPGAANFRTNDAGRIIVQCLSLCSSVTSSSFPLIPRRIIGGSELDEIDVYCSFGLQEAAEVRSIEDENAELFIQQSLTDDFDETDGRLPVLQRLALMRQRVSVDLDA